MSPLTSREKAAERTCSSGASLGVRLAALEARMAPTCFLFEGCKINGQKEKASNLAMLHQ